MRPAFSTSPRQIAATFKPSASAIRSSISPLGNRSPSSDRAAQLEALRALAAARGGRVAGEFHDDVTGNPLRRGRGDPPGLRAAFEALRAGDVLAVFAADRLVRSPIGLLQLVARVQAAGADVVSAVDGADLDTTSELGELFVFMRGWFARWERRLIVQRTIAGLDAARARGQRLGRPLADFDRDQARALAGEGMAVRAIARRLGVARGTLQRELARPAEAAARGPKTS